MLIFDEYFESFLYSTFFFFATDHCKPFDSVGSPHHHCIIVPLDGLCVELFQPLSFTIDIHWNPLYCWPYNYTDGVFFPTFFYVTDVSIIEKTKQNTRDT